MKITVVKIKNLNAGKLKAFADVSFDGVLVKGCKIFDGANGLFAALPSQKSAKDDKYYDTVVISDEVLKSEFSKAVIDAYKAQANSSLGPSIAEQEEIAQGGGQQVPF